MSHCPGCASALADEQQRFCVACGLRVAPDELRLARLVQTAPAPQLGAIALGPPRPLLRSAAITGVVVLALGIGIGATIGPAAVGTTAAAQPPVVVLGAAPTTAAAPVVPVALSAPSGDALFASGDDEPATPAADASSADTPAPAAGGDDAPAAQQPSGDDDSQDKPDKQQPAVAPPGSQQLAGVVVAASADGEGFALAARDGRLLAVHAGGCGLSVGDSLHLRARPLANGTWSADRVRRVRTGVTSARAAGTVDWVDPAGGRYALGARGATLLVSLPVAPADAAPAASPAAPPALGAQLRVRLTLTPAADGQPPTLVEQRRRDAPPPADPGAPVAPLELTGTLAAIDAQARTLVLGLDDAQPPSVAVTLSVPPAIALTSLLPAQRVTVTATPSPDGSYALTGVSPDADASSADDATQQQGDQAPATPPTGAIATTVVACTLLDGPAPSR